MNQIPLFISLSLSLCYTASYYKGTFFPEASAYLKLATEWVLNKYLLNE